MPGLAERVALATSRDLFRLLGSWQQRLIDQPEVLQHRKVPLNVPHSLDLVLGECLALPLIVTHDGRVCEPRRSVTRVTRRVARRGLQGEWLASARAPIDRERPPASV